MKSFPRGVHPKTYDGKNGKSLTGSQGIEYMPLPQFLYIPMQQHAGAPLPPSVKIGDTIKRGQEIAKGKSGTSIFSPSCGTVTGIEERQTDSGRCQHVIIETVDCAGNAFLEPLNNPSPQEIVKRVEDCGIVGLGGAGFPTAIKLNPGVPIDEVIINAVECEPYLTCDHSLMVEFTKELIAGALLIQKALDAKRLFIGIESNKPSAIAAIKQYVADNNIRIEVEVLKTKYPQGSDKHLIYALTKKKVPKGIRSSSLGVAVFNVTTAYAIYQAVYEGKQCYGRVMTVSGQGIARPANVYVYNGTTYRDIIEYCGGIKKDRPVVKFLSGGPMMGNAVYSLETATTKTTSGLLLLSGEETFVDKDEPCINCGKCARVCPMILMPMYIDAHCLTGNYDTAKKYGLDACIECGCCAFICPAKRNLVQSMRLAKEKIRIKERIKAKENGKK